MHFIPRKLASCLHNQILHRGLTRTLRNKFHLDYFCRGHCYGLPVVGAGHTFFQSGSITAHFWLSINWLKHTWAGFSVPICFHCPRLWNKRTAAAVVPAYQPARCGESCFSSASASFLFSFSHYSKLASKTRSSTCEGDVSVEIPIFTNSYKQPSWEKKNKTRMLLNHDPLTHSSLPAPLGL